MSLQSLRNQRPIAASAHVRMAAAPVCTASASASTRAAPSPVLAPKQQQPASSQQQAPGLVSRVLAGCVALGLGFGAIAPAHAAEFNSMADLVRSEFAFVDADKNGIITKDELERTSKEVANEVQFLVPGEQQMGFAMRLFDLDQDGTLTQDELLTSLALDGAISEDALDEGVWKVFDRNGDGYVDAREWRAGLPPLGPGGEGVKEYVFNRVDRLVDSNAKLDQREFANALTLVRVSVLGY